MQNTNIIQGSFTSTGAPVTIAIPMGVDWMVVEDYTQWGTAGTTFSSGGNTIQTSVRWLYQLGMADGTGIVEYKLTAALNGDTMKSGGFTATANPLILNDQVINPGAVVVVNATNLAITQSSGSPAVATITTDSIAGLQGFSVLRMNSLTTSKLFNGIDFQFDSLDTSAGTFNLTNTQATAYSTFTASATAANFVPQQVSSYWYPPVRSILNIVSNGDGTSKVVTTVTAPYVTGQTVRFNIPKAVSGANWGLPNLNGVVANVIGVTAAVAGTTSASFTIDIDVASGYGAAWNLPGSANVSLTQAGTQWATVAPIGDVAAQLIDTSGNPIATNKFSQAEFNAGYTGMTLGFYGLGVEASGTKLLGPAGKSGDKMYWKAGKSFSNQIGLYNFPPMPPLGS